MCGGQVFFKQGWDYFMKKTLVLTVLVFLFSVSMAFAGKGFPLTVSGYTLGADAEKYKVCCDIESASPLPDAPFLTEVHLKPDTVPGIRGGSLIYANCDEVGKLVRVKLKFHDRSQQLFKRLLKKYEAAFGKADSYEGDTFRNIIAWQWDFTKGDQRVTLLLMWSRVKDMRPGVSIKMTLSSLLDSEYTCHKARVAAAGAQGEKEQSQVQNLNDFVPR